MRVKENTAPLKSTCLRAGARCRLALDIGRHIQNKRGTNTPVRPASPSFRRRQAASIYGLLSDDFLIKIRPWDSRKRWFLKNPFWRLGSELGAAAAVRKCELHAGT